MSKLSFLASAKGRLITAVVVALVIIGVVVGIVVHVHHKTINEGSAAVTSAPSIKNVPGLKAANNEYVRKVNLNNQRKASLARSKGTSSIPTITRPDFIGNLGAFVKAGNKQKGGSAASTVPLRECPLKKTVIMFKPNPASCLPKNLQLARQAGVTAEELRCQGCSCPSLKLAGYTAGDLKSTGFEAGELKKCGFSLAQLIEAGYNAEDLNNAGFSASQLAGIGFSAGQ